MLYIFDGSESGFLTAFLDAFHDENALISSKQEQLILGQTPVFVQTDEGRAEKAKKRLLELDGGCIRELDLLLRCGQADNEQVAFAYLRTLANVKKPVRNRLSDENVFAAVEYIRKVKLEIHHFHGFIRFIECASGALYAPFSPDNDICDLLVPHFRARLPAFPFVLHDVKRKKAAVYGGKDVFVASLDKADVLLSADELALQRLWKGYYNAVNIPSRERLKQMRGYMPARYWAFMPEKNGDLPQT